MKSVSMSVSLLLVFLFSLESRYVCCLDLYNSYYLALSETLSFPGLCRKYMPDTPLYLCLQSFPKIQA